MNNTIKERNTEVLKILKNEKGFIYKVLKSVRNFQDYLLKINRVYYMSCY